MIYLQVTFLQAYAASFLPKQIILKFNIIKCNTDGFKIKKENSYFAAYNHVKMLL